MPFKTTLCITSEVNASGAVGSKRNFSILVLFLKCECKDRMIMLSNQILKAENHAPITRFNRLIYSYLNIIIIYKYTGVYPC